MTIEQLRHVREANPFRPFTIHLADGRSYRIPHRDYVSMPPNAGRTIIVYGEGEAFSILDMLLVTDLSVENSPTLPPITPSQSAA